jgi:DNA-binding NarL/FixJ family response regulator
MEPLTPRQQEVRDLLREGLTNPQIADRLGISLKAAEHHVSEVIGRLAVRNRYEAAMWP